MTAAQRRRFMRQFTAARREVARMKTLFGASAQWATLTFPRGAAREGEK